MQITDIKIRKTFENGPLKAIVSVTFDNALAVHDLKVVHAKEHYFVMFPNKKFNETRIDIVHPINSASRCEIESAVLGAYFARVSCENKIEE